MFNIKAHPSRSGCLPNGNWVSKFWVLKFKAGHVHTLVGAWCRELGFLLSFFAFCFLFVSFFGFLFVRFLGFWCLAINRRNAASNILLERCFTSCRDTAANCRKKCRMHYIKEITVCDQRVFLKDRDVENRIFWAATLYLENKAIWFQTPIRQHNFRMESFKCSI